MGLGWGACRDPVLQRSEPADIQRGAGERCQAVESAPPGEHCPRL